MTFRTSEMAVIESTRGDVMAFFFDGYLILNQGTVSVYLDEDRAKQVAKDLLAYVERNALCQDDASGPDQQALLLGIQDMPDNA
ncbi:MULTISPECIES: hypothetical protein [unclassified Chelatococcus]|uniref:hypothetical protein n=1 Tax=unclassified Chelatococcus TaxID=2638111 RepID=UPI0002E20AE1|nr:MULTISPECIES: hypothetical protein [unclassified Chelatococcus]